MKKYLKVKNAKWFQSIVHTEYRTDAWNIRVPNMNYKSKLNDHVNLKITYCNNNKERIKIKYIQIHRSRINQQLNPINHLSKKKKFKNQNHRQTNFLNRLS